MKRLILISVALFLGACAQDSGGPAKKDTTLQQQPSNQPFPVRPGEGSPSDSADPYWKSKKVSCSTRYVQMEYYLLTSLRFQADKMLSILDIHSWDNNAPGSSYKNTYTLKCELQPDPSNELSMVVCKEATGNMLIAEVVLQRNQLDEVKASVYVANQSSEAEYCSVENE